VSVLHTPSPSVTPTNLLYNVTATVLLPIGGWLAIGCGVALVPLEVRRERLARA